VQAADALRLAAQDLLRLRVVDEVLPEPMGGAHRDAEATAATVRDAVLRHLDRLSALEPSEIVARRREKYRSMGVFTGGRGLTEV
jgi:acetyl-CoA carboxylase carboxyl transferase subunit alpha